MTDDELSLWSLLKNWSSFTQESDRDPRMPKAYLGAMHGISSALMESSFITWEDREKWYSYDSKIDSLKAYAMGLELINQLGWLEHTSDWDPFLMIELKNGGEIQTESGYFLFEVKKKTILIEGDELPLKIKIKDIKRIVCGSD